MPTVWEIRAIARVARMCVRAFCARCSAHLLSLHSCAAILSVWSPPILCVCVHVCVCGCVFLCFVNMLVRSTWVGKKVKHIFNICMHDDRHRAWWETLRSAQLLSVVKTEGNCSWNTNNKVALFGPVVFHPVWWSNGLAASCGRRFCSASCQNVSFSARCLYACFAVLLSVSVNSIADPHACACSLAFFRIKQGRVQPTSF